MSQKNTRFNTLALHAGYQPDATGSRQVPIYQTTSYVFDDAQDAADRFALKKFGNIYSRLTNPTTAVLEERMVALEGGTGATVTSSGHAAQLLALLALMQPGDHLVAAQKLYGGTINQLKNTFPRHFGWQTTMVDVDDIDAVQAAITDKTKALFVESLANPGGVVTDIAVLAGIAHNAGIPLIVDNTMASPYLCRPIEHGADIVVHSTTKFLSGNGTAVGGALIDSGTFKWDQHNKFPALTTPEPSYHGINFYETFGPLALTVHAHAVGLRDLGPSQAPMNAFLTLNGIETLPLRMERHSENALKVASFLEEHPQVAWVSYAGLPSSPYHHLAQKYLTKGSGGAVFTFGVKGGYAAAKAVAEATELFSMLANIGDTRSLIIHPASTTHSQLNDQELQQAGASPEALRISVGIEAIEDIITDLDEALKKATNAA